MKISEIQLNNRVVSVFCAVVVLVLLAVGVALSPREVTVVFDAQAQGDKKVYTTAKTVKGLLEEIGMEVNDQLSEQVYVLPGYDTKIVNNMTIHVFNTIPVMVHVDNEIRQISLPYFNIKQVLGHEGILLNEQDRVEGELLPAGDTEISIVRVSTQVVEREVEVSFNTLLQPNQQLFRGERNILVLGEKGLKRQIISITYENNIPVAEDVLEEEVLYDPMDQLMEFGTRERLQQVSRSGTSRDHLSNFNVVKEMVVEATAYTHTGNTTFTGIWPYEGIVAVDPKVIPLGTKMYVEGYGFAEAQDTGGLIKGNIIDLFMDTHSKAVNWGRRQVKIYILE